MSIAEELNKQFEALFVSYDEMEDASGMAMAYKKPIQESVKRLTKTEQQIHDVVEKAGHKVSASENNKDEKVIYIDGTENDPFSGKKIQGKDWKEVLKKVESKYINESINEEELPQWRKDAEEKLTKQAERNYEDEHEGIENMLRVGDKVCKAWDKQKRVGVITDIKGDTATVEFQPTETLMGRTDVYYLTDLDKVVNESMDNVFELDSNIAKVENQLRKITDQINEIPSGSTLTPEQEKLFNLRDQALQMLKRMKHKREKELDEDVNTLCDKIDTVDAELQTMIKTLCPHKQDVDEAKEQQFKVVDDNGNEVINYYDAEHSFTTSWSDLATDAQRKLGPELFASEEQAKRKMVGWNNIDGRKFKVVAVNEDANEQEPQIDINEVIKNLVYIGFDKWAAYKPKVIKRVKQMMELAHKLDLAYPFDFGRGKGKYKTNNLAIDNVVRELQANDEAKKIANDYVKAMLKK